jgi:galactose mutarotase-like enzyme
MDVLNKGKGVLKWGPTVHSMWAVNHGDKSDIITEGLDGFDASDVLWDSQSPIDTPYPFNGRVVIELPDRRITIEEITEGKHVVENSVVWAPDPNDPEELENRNALAVEQVCGIVNKDDVLEQATSIPPGGEWHMKLRYTTEFKNPNPSQLLGTQAILD